MEVVNINKTTVIAHQNGKIVIKYEKQDGAYKKISRIYLTQNEAFKLAYKLMALASEL